MYTIKEIADLAGVTTRTLRHYDRLGILLPAEIGENGYRYYDRASLLRLQQVLFLRELSLPLKEIKTILDLPDQDPLKVLQDHRQAMEDQALRLIELLNTMDRTIFHLQGVSTMSESELFAGFDEAKYESEARERWGQTPQYQESQRKWSSYSREEKESIKQEGGEITRRMVGLDSQASPQDPEIQQAVGDYYAYLNRYFYTCDLEFLRNLAAMWVEDPRFAVNYENLREGGAAFVRKAVETYCDQHRD